MGPLVIGHALLLALSTLGTPRIRAITSPAAGLGPQAGVGRLDPSEILRFGESHVVLYTRTEASDLLYPAPYDGEIWWASSMDGGHTWVEQARVLGAGKRGREDSRGVFDPTVVQGPDGSPYLYYAGVGGEFNPRFELQGRAEATRIFVAQLNFDPTRGTITATRQGSGQGVLNPTPAGKGTFDSLRVRPTASLQRNGLTYLYYQGLAFRDGTNKSPLGLAIANTPSSPLRRAHQGLPVLPFDGDVLLGHHGGGILALFTDGDRGVWWAADGEHFAPLDVRVSGVLNSPGLCREAGQPDADAGPRLWGLHVASTFPDPYLARFDLQLEGVLPEPLEATIPIPSARVDPSWEPNTSWLTQHSRTRAEGVKRHPHYVLLGDDLIAGFGGQQRSDCTAGAASWNALFKDRGAINLGFQGDTTGNVIWRVDHGALPESRLVVVVLQVGHNQLGEQTPAEIAAGTEALIRRLRAARPSTCIVLTSQPIHPNWEESRKDDTAELNRRLARLGRRPHLRFLDLAATFGRRTPLMFDASRNALSADGYKSWAQALDPILSELEALVPEFAHGHLHHEQD